MSEAEEVWAKLRRSEQIVIRILAASPDDHGRVLHAILCLARRLPEGMIRDQINRSAYVGIGLHGFDRLKNAPKDDEDGS